MSRKSAIQRAKKTSLFVVGMVLLTMQPGCIKKPEAPQVSQASSAAQCALNQGLQKVGSLFTKGNMCGAMAALIVGGSLTPALADYLPPAVPEGLDTATPCTIATVDRDTIFSQFGLPQEVEEGYAAPTLTQETAPLTCKIPSGAVYEKLSWDKGRAALARIVLAHAMYAARMSPDQTISIPADFLYHYLMGTGNPKVLSNKVIVEDIEAFVKEAWLAQRAPASAEIFMDYEGHGMFKAGAFAHPAANSLGRAFVKVDATQLSPGKYSLRMRINDNYTWPGYTTPSKDAPSPTEYPALKVNPKIAQIIAAILGDKDRKLVWQNGDYGEISDHLWDVLGERGVLGAQGAKEFRMILDHTVTVEATAAQMGQ